MESLRVAFQQAREENTKAREQQRAQNNKRAKVLYSLVRYFPFIS
jgi:hypothetical protein